MNQVKCPTCMQVLALPEMAPGAKLKCPACHAMFRLPSAPVVPVAQFVPPPEEPSEPITPESRAEERAAPPAAKPRKKSSIRFGNDEEGKRMPGELMVAVGFLALNVLGHLLHLTGATAAALGGAPPMALTALGGILISVLAIVGIFFRNSIAWYYCANILPGAGAVLFFFPLVILIIGQDDLQLPRQIPKVSLVLDMLLFAGVASLAVLLRGPGVEAYFQWQGQTSRQRPNRPMPPWAMGAVAGLLVIFGYMLFNHLRHASIEGALHRRGAEGPGPGAQPRWNPPPQGDLGKDELKAPEAAKPAPTPSRKPPRALHAADEFPGLAAYFAFSEGQSDTTTEQIGMKPYSCRGCTWTDGVRGKALAFNGRDSRIVLDEMAALEFRANQPFTVSVWFAADGERGCLFSLRATDDRRNRSALEVFVNRLKQFQADVREEGRLLTWTSRIPLTVGWHHAALRRDPNGQITLHLDGAAAPGPPGPKLSGAIGGDLLRLGQEPVWSRSIGPGHAWFEGAIDEFAVFSRDLSDDEVKKLAEREAAAAGERP